MSRSLETCALRDPVLYESLVALCGARIGVHKLTCPALQPKCGKADVVC